jgi:hypothetical protein
MPNGLNIFLLIGQSNMAGRGKLDEVSELTHPDLFMFRAGHWLPAVEPLHTDKPRVAGVGLGMSFATEVIEKTGIAPVGLVPCAVGGTPLHRWMPGHDLYENAVLTAKSALVHGKLAGILWHQGEGDAGDRDDAASYAERFEKLVTSLRSDLSADNVPVVAGELGPFLTHHESCSFYELVNSQLKKVENTLPNYTCVSAEGLEDNGDSLHFNADSLRKFGIRYAEGFIQIGKREK